MAFLWCTHPTAGFANPQIIYLHHPTKDEEKILDSFFNSNDTYESFYANSKYKSGIGPFFNFDDVLVARANLNDHKKLAWIIAVNNPWFLAKDGEGFDVWEQNKTKWIYLGGDYLRDHNYIIILDKHVHGYRVIHPQDACYNLVLKNSQYDYDSDCEP